MVHRSESADRPALPPAQHHTSSVYERHLVGSDRRPISHTIVQGIIAQEPLQSIPYYFDTSEIDRITTGRGCTLGNQQPLSEMGLHVAELVLPRPLEPGERTTLEYTTWFNYASPPPPELRRRIGQRAMSVLDMCVQFESGYEPRSIWEARWPDVEPGSAPLPDSLVEVALQDSPTSLGRIEARRQETEVQPGVVLGYQWEW